MEFIIQTESKIPKGYIVDFVVCKENTINGKRSRYKGNFASYNKAINYGYSMGYEYYISGKCLSKPRVIEVFIPKGYSND